MVGVRSTRVHFRRRIDPARSEKREAGVVRQIVEPCCMKCRKSARLYELERGELTHGESIPNVHYANIEGITRELENPLSSRPCKHSSVVPGVD